MEAAPALSSARSKFLIAPWIGEKTIRLWFEEDLRRNRLRENQLTPAALIRNLLDSLQAPGIDNDVRLGYTIGICVFDLYRKNKAGEWSFDAEALRFFTDLLEEVNRPVVVHLRANHFVGESPLSRELIADESSWARTNTGASICETYATNTLFVPTFALDESIPFNRYRFDGFRQLCSSMAKFNRDHPGLIQAWTLAGELHHFMPGLSDAGELGRYDNVQMTDYSDASIREFRCWLRDRHESITRLNQRMGTSFATWDEVGPPRLDLRSEGTGPLWMHMDSYANGRVPVSGWALLAEGSTISVYLDGEYAGDAEYGLDRLDVYEAVKDCEKSDVGFRFDLDYRLLPAGEHVIHVIVRSVNGETRLIGRTTILVRSSHGSDGCVARNVAGLDALPPLNGYGYLDRPAGGMPVLYNPYAAEWQEFREFQVRALAEKFARIAIEAGLPREQLYSHHIVPHFEGAWNQVAFAMPPEVIANELLSSAITLYGGATVYRDLAKFVAGKSYAVAEFHPRMGRVASKGIFLRALEYHQKLGAKFLCPYAMALREPILETNAVEALCIHPWNTQFGSLFFYSALIEFLNRQGM